MAAVSLVLCAAPAHARTTTQPPAPSTVKKHGPSSDKKNGGKKSSKGKVEAPPTPKPAHAAGSNSADPPKSLALNLAIDKSTLDNGLRVVMNPDRGMGSVSVAMAYAAGAGNEAKGQAGFAQLAARAMNDSLAALPEYARLQEIIDRGASTSTYVDRDMVVFGHTLPSDSLGFALWLEAQRLSRGRVRDELVQRARQLLQDQSREPVSATRFGLARARAEALAYQGYWPYEHDVFGLTGDVASASTAALDAFRELYYVPNNATLAIVGEFSPVEAARWAHHYFDSIPRREPARLPSTESLPDQTNQRTAVLKNEHITSPFFIYGWAIPPSREPEHDALSMAAALLGHGERSRLAIRLTGHKPAPAASSFSVEVDSRRGPSFFSIMVQAGPDGTLETARRIVDEEIDTLVRVGPGADETRKAWRSATYAFLEPLENYERRAARLASLELLHGDARLVHAELGRILSVGKEEVQKSVARFLSPTRRTFVEVNATGLASTIPVADKPHPAPGVAQPSASPPPALKPKPDASLSHDKNKKKPVAPTKQEPHKNQGASKKKPPAAPDRSSKKPATSQP